MRRAPLLSVRTAVLLAGMWLLCGGCSEQRRPVVRLIFDTDMAPDYDDVGALAALHALADSGEVEILATVTSNRLETSVPCIEVINGWFDRPDLPTGGPKGKAPSIDTWHSEKWTSLLPERYPHRTTKTSDAPDAVAVYRRALAGSPDTSVVIVTVGFMSNLRDLLRSVPDSLSPLSGSELVARKAKRLVSMAGLFPQGLEFNIVQDAGAARAVLEQWPTEIIFSGAEIGDKIPTGEAVMADPEPDSPVREVYALCMAQDSCTNHASFDQTAVLAAVRGPGNYFATESGTLRMNADSSTVWTPGPSGRHARLVQHMDRDSLARIVDALMAHRPAVARRPGLSDAAEP